SNAGQCGAVRHAVRHRASPRAVEEATGQSGNGIDNRVIEQSSNTTLLVSLVQTRRIPYPLMRDGGPGARAVDAAWDVSRSVHDVLQSPSASHLRQSVPAGAAERQLPEIDAADAWPAERSRVLSRPAALHHAF